MFGRNRRVDERLERIEELLVGLGHDAELLRTVLVIREPDTVTAANAYEGLRKQIVAVVHEHWQSVAQLVEIDVSVNHTDDIEVVRRMADDWLIRSGVRRIDKPVSSSELTDLFEDLGGSGTAMEVRGPAYVDVATGRLIRKGRVVRTNPQRIVSDEVSGKPQEEEAGSVEDPAEPAAALDEVAHPSEGEAQVRDRLDTAESESVAEKPRIEE